MRGDATALPPLRVDLATMTANVAQANVAHVNVAQVNVGPQAWQKTLRGAYEALRRGHAVPLDMAPVAGQPLAWGIGCGPGGAAGGIPPCCCCCA